MGSDPLSRLRHLLQTLSFCLVVASLKAYLSPGESYGVSLVYSLAIGVCIWALIDFGRARFGPANNHGWPHGWRGPALVAVATPIGFVLGIVFGDLCFGWSSWHGKNTPELSRSMLVTLVASVVISYYFYSRGQSAGLLRSTREARQEAAEARLRLLEVQLEPHMLFNTLANLRVLVTSDAPRAEAMLDHFIAYLRATLDGARATWHPLGEEFARLDDYLALMAVRMGDRLTYSITLPAGLADAPVPPLLLQPVVENAIRHGLEPQLAGGSIQVDARHEGSQVVITVTDTGVGMPAEDAMSEGFGTRHVQERIASAWGDAADIRYAALYPHGTCVVIRFPVLQTA